MMFRRPTVTIALCLLSLALASRRASADLVLTFEPDQTTYNVGDSVQVSVYLTDNTASKPDPTDSPLNNSAVSSYLGLSKFGFQGTFDASVFSLPVNWFVPNPTAPLTASLIQNAGNVFTVTGNDTVVGDPGAYGAQVLDSNSNLVGFSLKLGTLTFTADQPSAGSSVTFSNSSFSPDFTVSGTSYTVASLTPSPSLTLQVNQPVSAVPEPGSMSLVALAGAGSMWLAHRRRRRSAK